MQKSKQETTNLLPFVQVISLIYLIRFLALIISFTSYFEFMQVIYNVW